MPSVVLSAMSGLSLVTGASAQEAKLAPVQLARTTAPAAPGAITRATAPPAAPATPIQPVDLSRYTCQGLMTDMLNKQMEPISMTVTISWGLARAKEDPTNARLDFAQIQPLNEAVWKSCAFGDQVRTVRDVVADEMKTLARSG